MTACCRPPIGQFQSGYATSLWLDPLRHAQPTDVTQLGFVGVRSDEVIFMSRVFRSAFVAILLLGLFAGGSMAQSSSSASSSASSSDGMVDVRLGGFVFEFGAHVALEFVLESDANCFVSGVVVEHLQLLDDQDGLIDEIVYEPPADIDGWLGQIRLMDPEGLPLPAGDYRLAVTTSVGTFRAEIEVADASQFQMLGRYSAEASVCGLSLRVYRMLTEEDAGSQVALRVGDRLMVVLEGNPTTGYEWSNTLTYEFATLEEIGESEFRPESNLAGAGGIVLFRYEAVRVGPQAFRFAYQRPWESVEPLELVEFSVDVY